MDDDVGSHISDLRAKASGFRRLAQEYYLEISRGICVRLLLTMSAKLPRSSVRWWLTAKGMRRQAERAAKKAARRAA